MNTAVDTPTGSLKTALQHAMSLLRNSQLDLAEEQATAILEQIPNEVNARFIIAITKRRQGHLNQAFTAIDAVVEEVPEFAEAHQERGLILQALGDATQAIQAFRKAVNYDKKLPASWKALAYLLIAEGDESDAREAFRHHLVASSDNADLLKAVDMIVTGRLGKAERVLRPYLKQHPNNVNAIRLLAEVGIKLGVNNDAENLLERCLELAPDYHMARFDYARVLQRRQKNVQALAELEKLLKLEPDNPAYLAQRATTLVHIGQYKEAIAIYERVLSGYSVKPDLYLSYGHALKTVGRQADSVAAYREAIAHQPTLGDAYWSMANLKTFHFSEEDVAAMRDVVDDPACRPQDRYQLCFALGKALEDIEQFDESFSYYQRGNQLKLIEVQYDPEETENNKQRMIAACDVQLFKQHLFKPYCGGSGCDDPAPFFIVGLPRSGSTLLEQVLASHSQVDGTKELPDIITIAQRLSGKKKRTDESKYPNILNKLSAQQLRDLGLEYLQRTRVQRGNAPFFIDKMPNNFSHIGLIHLMLPNAKIIDARRHPMATCFSGYKQLFAKGQNFSYDLSAIGRYYRDYAELMEHWDRVLPGRILRVQYEEVVADLETQVRRILDYCDLPFEENCLSFYNSERAVRTASSEQVRQPIYQSGLDHWFNFAEQLEPLKAALGKDIRRQYNLD